MAQREGTSSERPIRFSTVLQRFTLIKSRKMTARLEGTPLDELDDINLRLTKLVKNQLRKCKKFKHFVHLRDITLKNFARAFIRVR